MNQTRQFCQCKYILVRAVCVFERKCDRVRWTIVQSFCKLKKNLLVCVPPVHVMLSISLAEHAQPNSINCIILLILM